MRKNLLDFSVLICGSVPTEYIICATCGAYHGGYNDANHTAAGGMMLTAEMLSGKTQITVTARSGSVRSVGYCVDNTPLYSANGGTNPPQNCTKVTLGQAFAVPSFTDYIFIVITSYNSGTYTKTSGASATILLE